MISVATRAALVALLILALGSLAASSPRMHDRPAQSAAFAAPMAEINLPSLFGDENEPDENEPDEGGPDGAGMANSNHGSGVSLPVVALLVLLAGALGGYVYMRIRRLYFQLRAWTRGLWARL
jgi:hypothetical protein